MTEQRTIEQVEAEIAELAAACNCDCDDDDCVACSHYPEFLHMRRAELATLKAKEAQNG